MAERTYVPGYGYVTKGERGTGITSQPGWRRPASWDSQPSTAPDDRSQRGVASQPVPTTTTPTPVVNPTLPTWTGQDPNNPMYYNTLRVGRYGPPGGISGPLAQGTGAPGTALRELPKIFTAATVGDARDAYWSDPISRSLIEQAAAIHYRGNPNFSPQWAEGFWNDLVNTSINPGAKSPWEVLEGILSGRVGQSAQEDVSSGGGSSYYSGGGGGGYGGGGGGGGGSVSLTNPASARGLLMQTMQSVLGRNPTDREYKDFIKTLTQTEMANPNTVSVEGDVVVQSGGTDPGVLALEFAQAAEDYKSTQVNKFYNAFMGALGGGLSG